MTRKLSEEKIQKIREDAIKGKSKYKIARYCGVSANVVYNYTKDIPSMRQGEPCIRGKTLELLKELLSKGYVCTEKNGIPLHFLQKMFPVIKRSQFKNRSIYYLKDKNKLALQEMMKQDTSRIISFQELSKMSKVFNTDLEIKQKRAFLGKNLRTKRYKIKKIKKDYKFVSKEKQSKIDDFLGRFLHSEVLGWFCVI